MTTPTGRPPHRPRDTPAPDASVARMFSSRPGAAHPEIVAEAQGDPENRRGRSAAVSSLTPRPGAATITRGIASGELRPDLNIDDALDVLAGPLWLQLLVGHRPPPTDGRPLSPSYGPPSPAPGPPRRPLDQHVARREVLPRRDGKFESKPGRTTLRMEYSAIVARSSAWSRLEGELDRQGGAAPGSLPHAIRPARDSTRSFNPAAPAPRVISAPPIPLC